MNTIPSYPSGLNSRRTPVSRFLTHSREVQNGDSSVSTAPMARCRAATAAPTHSALEFLLAAYVFLRAYEIRIGKRTITAAQRTFSNTGLINVPYNVR